MIKVTGPWRENAATQAVCRAIARDGAQVYFVGGCVRNALLGVPVSDIDIATDATPDQVMPNFIRYELPKVVAGLIIAAR